MFFPKWCMVPIFSFFLPKTIGNLTHMSIFHTLSKFVTFHLMYFCMIDTILYYAHFDFQMKYITFFRLLFCKIFMFLCIMTFISFLTLSFLFTTTHTRLTIHIPSINTHSHVCSHFNSSINICMYSWQ